MSDVGSGRGSFRADDGGDTAVVEQAQAVARAAQEEFFALAPERAVVVSAVAGAGKSRLVVDTVAECRRRGVRVAVCAPTNEQVFGLVRAIAESDPGRKVAYVPARSILDCATN